MNIDLFYNDLLIKVSNKSKISFSELRGMDVYDFFLTLTNLTKE